MAKFELKLPKMGESVAEATITNWLKNVGDTIAMDEAVLEIATDKELSCEMAINMANYYFIQKSKDKFNEWANLVKQNASPNSQYIKYIEYFEKEWESKR